MKIKMLGSRIHRYLRNQHSKKKKLTCEGKREGRQHNTASAVRSVRVVCFARPDESDGSNLDERNQTAVCEGAASQMILEKL